MYNTATDNQRDRTAATPCVDYLAAVRPRSAHAIRLYEESRARGLEEVIPPFASADGAIALVNPFHLTVKPGWNLRRHQSPENVAHILTLAHSIVERDVSEPLTVCVDDTGAWLTDGHCRFLAVMHAINYLGSTLTKVPVKLEAPTASEADMVAGQLTRNLGKPFSPSEKAAVCQRLREYGLSIKTIGSLLGVSGTRIEQLLKFNANTNDAIHQLIQEGRITASFAARTLTATGNDVSHATRVLTDAIVTANASGKRKASAKHLRLPLPALKSNAPSGCSPRNDVFSSFIPDSDEQAPGSYRAASSAPYGLGDPNIRRSVRSLFKNVSAVFKDGHLSVEFDAATSKLLAELLSLT